MATASNPDPLNADGSLGGSTSKAANERRRPPRMSQMVDDGNVQQSDAPLAQDASERALPIFKYCGNWGIPKTPVSAMVCVSSCSFAGSP
jgi:hypothetical protein